jgi:hypothetical protein
MSRINGDNACPKCKITATDRVTDPSNEATPILASHQAAADAAEAKQLAKAAATHAKPPAPPNAFVGATSPNSTFFSDWKKQSVKNAKLSGSDASPESGEKFKGATEGTLTDLFTDSFIAYAIGSILDESDKQSVGSADAPPKKEKKSGLLNV